VQPSVPSTTVADDGGMKAAGVPSTPVVADDAKMMTNTAARRLPVGSPARHPLP
jgi:hypothetical protein